MPVGVRGWRLLPALALLAVLDGPGRGIAAIRPRSGAGDADVGREWGFGAVA